MSIGGKTQFLQLPLLKERDLRAVLETHLLSDQPTTNNEQRST
jgi:hypothetical protein